MIICSIQGFSTGSNGVQTYELRDPKTNFMFTHESNKEVIRLESVVARYCVSLGKRFDGLDLGENAHEKLSLSIDPCPKKARSFTLASSFTQVFFFHRRLLDAALLEAADFSNSRSILRCSSLVRSMNTSIKSLFVS